MLDALKARRICSFYPIETPENLPRSKFKCKVFSMHESFSCQLVKTLKSLLDSESGETAFWCGEGICIQAILNFISISKIFWPVSGFNRFCTGVRGFPFLHNRTGIAASTWPESWCFPSSNMLVLCYRL